MKTLSTLLFLLALLPSCFTETEEPVPEPTLPPITTEGNNTFGCLINGELFLAEKTPWGGFFEDDPLRYSFYSDSTVVIDAISFENRTRIALQGIYSNDSSLKLFNKELTGIHKTHFVDNNLEIGGKYFYILENSQDSIKYLRNDRKVVSGIFSFTAIHIASGDTLRIRDGRFDILKQ
ncbi:MAG: hypothetical protein H6608_05080 [Flavobacteriales bacterium]|nr:hypothetical protein [Flavobacteriales bacterium]